MNKEKILLIICLIFFILGIIALILNFIYTNTNLYLCIALGCIAIANIIIFIINVILKNRKKIK